MASRLAFLPRPQGNAPVEPRTVTFSMAAGAGLAARRENVRRLHAAAAALGLADLQEVSTAAPDEAGRAASAFALTVEVAGRRFSVESAYHASKVFAGGGPFADLLAVPPADAKADPRLRSSGPLRGFRYDGRDYAAEPPTAFYDWLYIGALLRDPARRPWLASAGGFTDIAFVPGRSRACQARACALAAALLHRGTLDRTMRSFEDFVAETGGG